MQELPNVSSQWIFLYLALDSRLGISFVVLIMTYVWKTPELASLSPTTSFTYRSEFLAPFSNWMSYGHLKFNISKADLVISSLSVMHIPIAEFSVPVWWHHHLSRQQKCLHTTTLSSWVFASYSQNTSCTLISMGFYCNQERFFFIFQDPDQMLTHL